MSGTIWPVDAVSGSPSYTGRMLREAALTSLVGGATAARPFGGISGVRPGTSSGIGSMSGLNYTVTPFGGIVDGEASSLAGAYGFAFSANETGTIPAQTGTARTGLLSVKINDPAEGDAGLPSVALVYTDSLASPGHGFDLYKVNIPATGGGSPTLTWVAPYTAAAGGTVPYGTAAQLSAVSGSYVGQAAVVIADATASNNGEYRWNGTTWAPRSIITSGKTSAPPANAQFIEKIERVTVTTSGSAVGTITFPTAFPNGVVGIWLTVGSGIGSAVVLNGDTLTTTGCQFFAGSAANTALVIYYRAIGW